MTPLLANIYLDALDRELERGAIGSAGKRMTVMSTRQSGSGGTGDGVGTGTDREASATAGECRQERGREDMETKFLGFRLNRKRQIEAALESLERFQAKVRELWRSCRSRSSNQLRDAWRQYVIG